MDAWMMTAPEALRDVMALGLRQVREHPAHHLELGYRQLVWEALGPTLDRSQPYGGKGHHRRTVLDRQAAEHALPIWDAAWPKDMRSETVDDTAPREVLAMARQTLVGPGDDGAISTQILYLWTDYDEACHIAADEHIEHSTPLVLLATIKALMRAWNDMEFAPGRIAVSATDGHQGYHVTDAAYDASVAYAGGLPWDTEANHERRREFWDWWLLVALPAAWDAAPE